MLYEVLIVIIVVNLRTDAEDVHFPGQPGVPVRHADVIRPLILRHVLKDAAHIDGDAVANFILNGSAQPEPASSLARNVLDAPTFKLIARNISEQLEQEMAQRKQKQIQRKDDPMKRRLKSGRRRYENKKDNDWDLIGDYEALEHLASIKIKSMDLMKQSVYQTRYHLQRTKPFRKRYEEDGAFRIGVLYGSMMINKNKIEMLWWTMRKFEPDYTKIHMYLVVYEKILATHTDITYQMKMMFDLFKIVQEAVEDMAVDDGDGKQMITRPSGNEAVGEGPDGDGEYGGGRPAEDAGMGSAGGFPRPAGKRGARRSMAGSRRPAHVLTPVP